MCAWERSGSSRQASEVLSAEELARRLADVLEPSALVVCTGNELRGDDGAGVAVARELAGALPWPVLDAATAPESFLGKIVDAKPGTVLLVDALHFGGSPGAVRLLEREQLGGLSPSTHGPSPVMFFQALLAVHACRTLVLGIQPERLEVGAGLSEPVLGAVRLVVDAFRRRADVTRRA